jgi:2-polyprenyl-3-methyl-5-hydroxy-6-metoxy-1,4-benzoquinol methylase
MRILLLADRPGWAHDNVAHALAQRLQAPFEVEFAYAEQRPELDPARYDLLYVFFWGERWHKRRFFEPSQVLKELSSHRFQFEAAYGPHTPTDAVERFMREAGTLVATSKRLYDLFSPVHSRVRQYRLGVDTATFHPRHSMREGPIRVCWVGNEHDPLKGREDVLIPAMRRAGIEIIQANGSLSQSEMVLFYHNCDVLAVSSVAEGTPLPLLEAMACGLWIVSTDVGVVSELIRDGEGGRIVPRQPEAFAEALLEACSNPVRTRQLGYANAARIELQRNWDLSSATFRDLLKDALAYRRQSKTIRAVPVDQLNREYHRHLEQVNPAGFSDQAYLANRLRLEEDLRPLLPTDLSARILEIGSGFGHCIRWLSDIGYMRLTAIDLSALLLEGVRNYVGERMEYAEVADAREYLGRANVLYDFIILFDVIEHMSIDDARELLINAKRALTVGGKVVIRTPNMSNALGSYSRYLDITHLSAFTEQSLLHVIHQSGFSEAGVHIPKGYSFRRRAATRLNEAMHRALFRLQDRSMPTWYGKNIVLWAGKADYDE